MSPYTYEPLAPAELEELYSRRPPMDKLQRGFRVTEDVWPIEGGLEPYGGDVPSSTPLLHFGVAFNLGAPYAKKPASKIPSFSVRLKASKHQIELLRMRTDITTALYNALDNIYNVHVPLSAQYTYVVSFYTNYSHRFRMKKGGKMKQATKIIALLHEMGITDCDEKARWWWDCDECAEKYLCLNSEYNIGGRPHPSLVPSASAILSRQKRKRLANKKVFVIYEPDDIDSGINDKTSDQNPIMANEDFRLTPFSSADATRENLE